MDKPFTKMLIRYEIEEVMKRADLAMKSGKEFNFLSVLSNIRERAVNETKVITDDEFNEICRDILTENKF